MPIAFLNFFRFSRSFAVLLGVFLLACGLGYLVVKDAVDKTIEHQALAIAEIVASQATTARSVYARDIAEKLKNDGFGPSVDSATMPGHVPIPAQFLKLVGRASSLQADKLYEYKPVSRWNLEPSQGLTDDFLRWAWPQLEKQDQPKPQAPIAWKAVSRFEVQNGQRVLRYLSADPASQMSCVACHNGYEKTPAVLAIRQTQGVDLGKQWTQHQLLGALSITIPLDKAEQVAGNEVRRGTVFVLGILVASFVAIAWFNWRLTRQRISLRETETQLARSELEMRSANAIIEAKHGVEDALAELSTYMRAIDQHAVVSVSDLKGRIVQVNDMFVKLSGYSREELMGQDHRIVNSGIHPKAFFVELWSTIARGDIWRGVICNRNKSGQLYWVDSAIVPLKDHAGTVVRYISIRIDVTERKHAEQELLHVANHDALTGLVNRNLLRERIRKALEGERSNPALPAAVLFIDLDQFKGINDMLGHDVGDQLLLEVSQRLLACVRAEDTVARQGGDEFIVFLPRISDAQGAAVLAEKLLAALSSAFHIGGRELHIGSSIGIAVYPHDGQDVETLLKNSDTAMYQVKETGRNNYLFFAPAMNQLVGDRYALSADLRRAAERNELLLHFQPIVDIATGEIASMEVLLRWKHPVRGLVSPLQFIPLAEASGLIVPIGEWVLHTACLQLQEWTARGLLVPRLAINLSAIQFQQKNIVDSIRSILAETGTDPRSLELEITEGSLLTQSDGVLASLKQLTELGFNIAIDDFGTGYSSLSYLKRFPIDTLKIDRSFVMDITQDPDDDAIVKAMIAMGHSLKMRVIAEGVETPEQLAFLRAEGCDLYQGYLFSKPMPAHEVQVRLRRAREGS